MSFRWVGRAAGAIVMAAALLGCGGGDGDGPVKGDYFVELTASVVGQGSVRSQPSGIDCGAECTALFTGGHDVTLTAAAPVGHRFVGWSGACTGTAVTCVVRATTPVTATATFRATAPESFPLQVSITGAGAVRSQPSGIDCGSSCRADFATDTAVTLTAFPDAGHSFTSWGGACTGAGVACSLRLSEARTVTARFDPTAAVRHRLTVSVAGNGSVTSAPVGIACGSDCQADFAEDSEVVLTALPSAGQVFAGWTGGCSGNGLGCTVTMTGDLSVAAAFAPAPTAPGWQIAQLLETNDDFNIAFPGSRPQLLSAIGPQGDAIVLWEQSDGTPDGDTRQVYSRRYAAGQGWLAAEVVPGLSTRSSSQDLVSGRVFMDGAGVVTWVRHDMETRRHRIGSGWSAPFSPAFNGAGDLTGAAMDANGRIVAVISRLDVFSTVLTAGGSWEDWVRLDQSGSESAEWADLALSSDGSAVAVWREGNPGDNRHSLKAARWLPGTGWGAPQAVDTSLDEVSETGPRVAIDGSGQALALWHQGGAVHVARFAPASGWAAPTVLESVNLGTDTPLALAMAPSGRAVVAWIAPDFGRNQISVRTMTYTPGSGFSAPVTATPFVSDWRLGMDDDGNASLVYTTLANWPDSTSADFDLQARRLPWGGVWSAASTLETGAGSVLGHPAVAFNGQGRGVAAWGQNDSASTNIRNSLWASVLR